MSALLPLALATPLFGFALSLQPAFASAHHASVGALAPAVAALSTAEVEPPDEETSTPTLAEQMERRSRIAGIHRALGLTTFAMTTLTVASGVVQYRNLYGGGNDSAATPCGRGDAWPSQSQCSGHPIGHLTLGMLTGALYFTTFGLSYAMPDPYHASEGHSAFARRLRAHKALRWVHFSGMIAQLLLGVFIANAQVFGLDRANDYHTLRALATTHLAIGGLTWASLGTAGALMMF